MLAVPPSALLSWLPPVGPCLPNLARILPSRENLRRVPSLLPLPVSQTLFFASTRMPCSVSGQSGLYPGPPQDETTLPSASNSITEGAAWQHFAFFVLARSTSRSERGR